MNKKENINNVAVNINLVFILMLNIASIILTILLFIIKTPSTSQRLYSNDRIITEDVNINTKLEIPKITIANDIVVDRFVSINTLNNNGTTKIQGENVIITNLSMPSSLALINNKPFSDIINAINQNKYVFMHAPFENKPLVWGDWILRDYTVQSTFKFILPWKYFAFAQRYDEFAFALEKKAFTIKTNCAVNDIPDPPYSKGLNLLSIDDMGYATSTDYRNYNVLRFVKIPKNSEWLTSCSISLAYPTHLGGAYLTLCLGLFEMTDSANNLCISKGQVLTQSYYGISSINSNSWFSSNINISGYLKNDITLVNENNDVYVGIYTIFQFTRTSNSIPTISLLSCNFSAMQL